MDELKNNQAFARIDLALKEMTEKDILAMV